MFEEERNKMKRRVRDEGQTERRGRGTRVAVRRPPFRRGFPSSAWQVATRPPCVQMRGG